MKYTKIKNQKMDNKKLLKALFQRMVLKFETVNTDKGELIVDGAPEIGKDVLIDTEEGMVAPEDGTYVTETQSIKVEGGIIVEISEINPEGNTQTEENTPEGEFNEKNNTKCDEIQPDDKDAKIAELTDILSQRDAELAEKDNIISEKDAEIETLKAKIAELEDSSNRPVENPVSMSKTVKAYQNNDNPALKYFNN